MNSKDILEAIPRRELARHFIVSDRSKFVYAPTPKVASSSVTLALLKDANGDAEKEYTNLHREAREFFYKPANETAEALANKDYTHFCVVRHPVSRFVSAYRNKMNIKRFRRQILDVVGEADDRRVSFDEFLQVVAAQKDEERDRHWRSQSGILFPDIIAYDHVLRMENLSHDWGELNKSLGLSVELSTLNSSGGPKNTEQIDYEKQLQIADMFKDDMDTFGYDIDKAKNVSRGTDKGSSKKTAPTAIKPSFLYVGLGKTGSSLMHHVIQRHPDVFLSQRGKELNFFSMNINYDRGQDYYDEMFAEYGGEAVIGDITPGYYAKNAYLERIVDYYGGTPPKIVLSVRNPITQLFSRFVQVLKIGDYLSKGMIPQSFAKEIERNEFFINGYKQISEVIDRLGGPSNILLLVYEKDFRGDYQFEQKIYDFMGIDSSKNYYDPVTDSSVNSGLLPRIIAPKSEDWVLEVNQKRYDIPANRAYFSSTSRRTRVFTPDDREYQTISEQSERQEEWGYEIEQRTKDYIRETQLLPIRELLESKFDVDLAVWENVDLPQYTVADPPDDLRAKDS